MIIGSFRTVAISTVCKVYTVLIFIYAFTYLLVLAAVVLPVIAFWEYENRMKVYSRMIFFMCRFSVLA